MLQAAIDAFRQPDLRQKLLFTLGMLVVFRFVAHVPLPNVNQATLSQAVDNNSLLGYFNIFSGGALRRMSVAALGVYPYITASIVMQMLTPLVPRFAALQKEGEQGRNTLQRYTHWLCVPVAAFQGYAQLLILENSTGGSVFTRNIGLTGSDLLPTMAMIASTVAGTLFLVWLGELITERGIGNGISLLILAGIVAGLPQYLGSGIFNADGIGGGITGLIMLFALGLLMLAAIVVFQEAQRKIPVQYARSVFRQGRMYRQSGTSHIPLKVNSAGMIPLLFAFTIMIAPNFIAQTFQTSGTSWVRSFSSFMADLSDPRGVAYQIGVFILVVAFTFFYSLVLYQQQNLAENLQKSGGFIPGIRPGRPTQDYISRVLIRITWAGAIFLGIMAIVPFLATRLTGVQALTLSSTGLLIVVGVVLDTMRQIEAQLLMRNYEGFIR
ncbi:MAG: preprotein translocase subunit SecY [Chloroflexi bacterium]|nr:preprotein translocase subunit SecY [Chloroflexota bacterium]